LIGPETSDCVSLNENVTLGQQLNRLQSRTVRTNQPLAPLDKPILVPHQVSDLDDFGPDVVLQDSDRLFIGNGSSQKFEHVSSLDDYVGVPTFPGRLDGHRAFHDVQLGLQVVAFHQKLLNQWPTLTQISFAVLKS